MSDRCPLCNLTGINISHYRDDPVMACPACGMRQPHWCRVKPIAELQDEIARLKAKRADSGDDGEKFADMSEELRAIIVSMAQIVADAESSDSEKSMAMDTLIEAVYPGAPGELIDWPTEGDRYIGSKIVAFGKDGSVLIDLPVGGDRVRIWPGDAALGVELKGE